MIKKSILLIVVLVALSASAAAVMYKEGLQVTNLRIGDYGVFYPWESTLVTSVTVSNLANKDLDDFRVSLTIDELGLETSSSTFDLGKATDKYDHKRRVFLFLDMPPNIKQGEYLVRIVVENGDIKRVKYMYLFVI